MYGLAVMLSVATRTPLKNIDKIIQVASLELVSKADSIW